MFMSTDSAFNNFQFRWDDLTIKIIITFLDTFSLLSFTFRHLTREDNGIVSYMQNTRCAVEKTLPQRPRPFPFPRLWTALLRTGAGPSRWRWQQQGAPFCFSAHVTGTLRNVCLWQHLSEGASCKGSL